MGLKVGLRMLKRIFIKMYKHLLYYFCDRYYRAHGLYAFMHLVNEKNARRAAAPPQAAPLVSMVVVSNDITGISMNETLDTAFRQTYEQWELLICVTPSLPLKNRLLIWLFSHQYPQNCRIRVLSDNSIVNCCNSALALATGKYICFVEAKAVLETTALSDLMAACDGVPMATLAYSDEDWLPEEAGDKRVAHFKPDWASDTFRSFNYLARLCLIRTDVLRLAGGFRREHAAAFEYDALLRVTERTPPPQVVHVPKLLFHNGTKYCPTEEYAISARRALAEHIARMGWSGQVTAGRFPGSFRIRYGLKAEPVVSIIIPNMDHAEDLERCVHSIFARSTYKSFEVLIIENNSLEQRTEKCYNQLLHQYGNQITLLRWKAPFNFSALHNWAIPQAKGSVILCLNNDTEVITPDWLERMLEFVQRPDVGVVGCALLYRDDTYQHAGFIFGIRVVGVHAHRDAPRSDLGYWGRLKMVQNLSAVTGACMMFKKADFFSVSGFDEDYVVAVSDVDLCLKFRAAGKINVYVPDAELYHDEMKTRGKDDDPLKSARFERECALFYAKWGRDLVDPYYNKNLTRDREDFSY